MTWFFAVTSAAASGLPAAVVEVPLRDLALLSATLAPGDTPGPSRPVVRPGS